ncbi:hypothetical protein [Aliifodinibius sp. S!AR15-10]|nr:hypothetical protein [Aliifodinibius sp. S!AR15-10]
MANTLNQKLTKMDVDLSSIIISIVAFSFFIIPIVYDQWKKKG